MPGAAWLRRGDARSRDGLRREDLEDPDALVPCTVYGELIERAQRSRFTPNIGLRVGACMPVGSYALLDYLIFTAEDVEAGVRQLSHYFTLVSDSLRVELEEAEGAARVAWVGSVLPFSVEMTTARRTRFAYLGRDS
jgi:hypothetical protein